MYMMTHKHVDNVECNLICLTDVTMLRKLILHQLQRGNANARSWRGRAQNRRGDRGYTVFSWQGCKVPPLWQR